MDPKKKVLIVEDDRDLRVALNARLRASGLDTAFAADGMQALAVARAERPDLMLLDLGLPAGDGFVVLDRVKDIADLAAVPTIVISARDAESNRQRALDAGAVRFLQKPVDNEVLMSAIWSALDTH
jgi:two-component system cell cycle response regulator